ncbi:hypothetical protein B0A48_09733 [Cryoendolithus antarcticus]|uniref:BZIP domain-containing protein n=1 Tax=Cryoendolithus antarcticus TaxID=1507870 RepID=A0A1V8T2Z9_9PEZI|nr:hypothetical protein B0A48_09733 [Cryoendolithus antarcticus]
MDRLHDVVHRIRHARSAHTIGPKDDDSEEAQARRREQVYQAQKRHRNRKAEYLQTLEAEIIRLQHDDAQTSAEKTKLARENAELRALLESCSTDVRPPLTQEVSVDPREAQSNDIDMADVDIHFDPIMHAERTFVAFPATQHSTASSSSTVPSVSAPEPDSWVALDFILALEHPCRGHIQHPGIAPDAHRHEACEIIGIQGHALTTTSAVLASAQSSTEANDLPNHCELKADVKERWRIPYAEVEKLVALSEKLALDDEILTPAQAYAAVRRALPSGTSLQPVLERLKELLAKVVECCGLGTVMKTEVFQEHLSSVLKT